MMSNAVRLAARPIAVAGMLLGGSPAFASFLRPIGPISQLQRVELIWASVIVAIAILPVLIGVPLILWRYRRSNASSAAYTPQWHFDTKLEILMWGVPTAIVIAFGIWLGQAVFRIDPYRTIDAEMARGMEFAIDGPPIRVEVVGLDWKWLYLYPEEGVASVGGMVLPINRPLAMRLTSDTVMQSYMAPGLAGQVYAMAGMETRLNVIADRVGETLAENTQYNGQGFPAQRAPVRAVSDADYAEWIARGRAAPPLDDRSYALLAKAGDVAAARADLGRSGSGPLLFSLPDEELFGRVLARYTNGEAVAPENQPGAPSYDPGAARLPDRPSMAGGRVACTPVGLEDAAADCPPPGGGHGDTMGGTSHE